MCRPYFHYRISPECASKGFNIYINSDGIANDVYEFGFDCFRSLMHFGKLESGRILKLIRLMTYSDLFFEDGVFTGNIGAQYFKTKGLFTGKTGIDLYTDFLLRVWQNFPKEETPKYRPKLDELIKYVDNLLGSASSTEKTSLTDPKDRKK